MNLVQEGYYDFIKRVKIFINTTGIDGLNIDYFADCYGAGYLNKSDSCYNAEEERPINFTVQLHLTKRQDRNYVSIFSTLLWPIYTLAEDPRQSCRRQRLAFTFYWCLVYL